MAGFVSFYVPYGHEVVDLQQTWPLTESLCTACPMPEPSQVLDKRCSGVTPVQVQQGSTQCSPIARGKESRKGGGRLQVHGKTMMISALLPPPLPGAVLHSFVFIPTWRQDKPWTVRVGRACSGHQRVPDWLLGCMRGGACTYGALALALTHHICTVRYIDHARTRAPCGAAYLPPHCLPHRLHGLF